MAACVMQNYCVRIRIAEIKLWEDQKIQPFWLLIHFESSPLICNVEEKIVCVLNSLIPNHNDNGSLANQSCNSNALSSESSMCHWPTQDSMESIPQKEQSHLKNFTMSNITENDDTAKETHCHENKRCCGDHEWHDGGIFKIISCKLWMEGFLLLSSESSQIFQNGDLVTVKCDWRRHKTLSKETVTSVNANRNDPVEASVLKKQKKKKRKHEDSLAVNESFGDNCKDIRSVKQNMIESQHEDSLAVNESFGDNCKDIQSVEQNMIESHKNSDQVTNNSFQGSVDSAPKQKLRSKKSKNKNYECVLEENMSKSINENCTYEQNVNYFEDAGRRAQNDSGEELRGLPCQNSDLLLLMDKKIEELTKNHDSSPKLSSELSENHKKNDEFQGCNGSKRKRRRKRKKKANDNTITETKEKTTPVWVKFSPLKLPAGCQPENTRLTFETDSECDESKISSINTYNEKQKTKKLRENVKASPNFASHEDRGDSELTMEKLSVTRTESVPVLKKDIKPEKASCLKMKMKASPLGKSPTSDFAHGRSINPNSKFDELLQRRKLSGNNCSVSTLQNGAFIFTRERQKEKKEYGQICQTATNMMSSEERQLDLKESASGTKEENMDTSQATIVEAQQMSCLPTPPNLIEVTPVYLDVERCKPLDGLPQAGDIIAYKILELSQDYTPALSEFKQGQVISCEDGMIQIELFESSAAKKRTGRFELVFEQEEEQEEVSCNNNYVSVEVAAMVDARLVQRN